VHRLLLLAEDLLYLLPHRIEVGVERCQDLRSDAIALMDEAEQDVLSPDVVVVEHPRLFLGEDDDPTCSVGKSFKHDGNSLCRFRLASRLTTSGGKTCRCSPQAERMFESVGPGAHMRRWQRPHQNRFRPARTWVRIFE